MEEPRTIHRHASSALSAVRSSTTSPGEDRYDAPLAERLRMIGVLVNIQMAWLGRAVDLTSIGLPDWRGPALTSAIQAFFDRSATIIDEGDRRALDDQPAFMAQAAASDLVTVRAHWSAAWRRHVPGSDPDRAVASSPRSRPPVRRWSTSGSSMRSK